MLILLFGGNRKLGQSGIYADEAKTKTIQKLRPPDSGAATDDMGCDPHCSTHVFVRYFTDAFDE